MSDEEYFEIYSPREPTMPGGLGMYQCTILHTTFIEISVTGHLLLMLLGVLWTTIISQHSFTDAAALI